MKHLEKGPFQKRLAGTRGLMQEPEAFSIFVTWGHKWGGPNFSLSSVSSFPSDLLRAQSVDPAEKVSVSRRIALGGVLRSIIGGFLPAPAAVLPEEEGSPLSTELPLMAASSSLY